MRSDEWPAWFSFCFSGRWRALAKGTAWAGFYVQYNNNKHACTVPNWQTLTSTGLKARPAIEGSRGGGCN